VTALVVLVSLLASVASFVATYILVKSIYIIEPDHIGYYLKRGRAIERTLYPGMNFVGIGAQAYQVPTASSSRTVSQQVVLPDGSEVEITVGYSREPDSNCVWKLHTYGADLDGILERKVRSCLSKFSAITTGGPQTWEAALESYDDVRIEVSKELRSVNYGVRFNEIDVVHIKKAGIMAGEDLRSTIRKKSQNYSEVDKAKRRAEKLKELETLADQLRKVGTPEPEIKRIVERARIQILDDE
jgi:hypothetical protein